MKQHVFVRTAGVIFFVLGLLHAVRLLEGWQAVINGWRVPMGLSYAVVIVAAYLAYQAYTLNKS